MRAAVLAYTVLGGVGCLYNPSYFPHYLPPGTVVQTHAKPSGHGQNADFDPHACRIDVQPVDSCGPVRTQHLLVATVSDDRGQARRQRRVEWMLQGVGQIIAVDEAGYFSCRGYKVDNQYAVTYTSMGKQCIPWGDSEVTIYPGQTYCIIGSAIEGTSALTAYCPAINDPNKHKAFVNRHWLDARWQFPAAAVCPAGSRPTLTTQITRPSDGQPLTAYRVRYRVIDGADVTLLPGQGPEAIVPVDPTGRAVVAAGQLAAGTGPRRVAIEVLRPDPGNPAGPGMVIGTGETTLEWQSTPVDLDLQAPAGAALGRDFVVRANLHNRGNVATAPVTVRQTIPDGAQYVSSDPPATLNGNEIAWSVPQLQAGGTQTLKAVYRPARPGALQLRAEALGGDGARAEATATTQVGVGQLNLRVTGPTEATLGDTVTYDVRLTNGGQSPVTGVVLRAELDPGLEHASAARQLEIAVPSVTPGESKSVQLPLAVRSAGRLRTLITARGDGSPAAVEERFLSVSDLKLEVKLVGPTRVALGQPATWTVRATKAGKSSARHINAQVQLPSELGTATSTNGQLANGLLTWDVTQDSSEFSFTATPVRMVERTTLVASVRAAGLAEQRADLPVTVFGVPMLKVSLESTENSVEVGRRVVYTVTLRNAGSLPLQSVNAAADFGPKLRPQFGSGPTMTQVEGSRVIFGKIAEIRPGQAVTFRVEAEAVAIGDARVRVEANSSSAAEPVVQEEATRVIAARK
jgi:uncharacterized repeat protein (TIGR01451 family)